MQFNLYTERSIHAVFPFGEIDMEDGTSELYTTNTFTGLTSPHLQGRWNHDEKLIFATASSGTMRVYVANGALHTVFDYDPTNEINKRVFEMVAERQNIENIGCSPGFDKSHAGNSKEVSGVLREMSLTNIPANTASYTIMQGEISMKQIAKQQADHRRWLNEQKRLINKKAETDNERYKNTSEEFRAYLNEQRKLSQALKISDTRPLMAEEIAQIKATSPYFRSYPGMPPGYERVAFSTK